MRDYSKLLEEMFAAHFDGTIKQFFEGLSADERGLLEHNLFEPMIDALKKIAELPAVQQLMELHKKLEATKWN